MRHEGLSSSEGRGENPRQAEFEQFISENKGTRSILAATSVEGKTRVDFLDTEVRHDRGTKEKLIDRIQDKTPDDLVYTEVSQKSEKSRREYWAARGGEDYMSWKAGVSGWVHEQSDEMTKKVLTGLGFHLDATEDADLMRDVDTFHTNFFQGESNVKMFVQEIADNADKKGEVIDIHDLKKRVDSVRDLLVCFGKTVEGDDYDVDALVADYVSSYGLLDQPRNDKKVIGEIIAREIKEDLPSAIIVPAPERRHNPPPSVGTITLSDPDSPVQSEDSDSDEQKKPESVASVERERTAITIGATSIPNILHPERNEDAHFPENGVDTEESAKEKGLIVACDGVGGGNTPEEASHYAIDFLRDKELVEGTVEETRGQLLRYVQEINTAIHQINTQRVNDFVRSEEKEGRTASDKVKKRRMMGTTLIAAKLWEGEIDGEKKRKAIIVHRGDSRAYKLKTNGTLEQLTLDDNPQWEFENGNKEYRRELQKKLSLIEDRTSLDLLGDEAINFWNTRHVTKALGRSQPEEPNIEVIDLEEGDMLLLTTDGIHDNLTDSEIAEIIQNAATPQEATGMLVHKARERSRSGLTVDEIQAIYAVQAPDGFSEEETWKMQFKNLVAERNSKHFRAKLDDMTAVALQVGKRS